MTHALLVLSRVDTVGCNYKIFYECDILYFELSNCVFFLNALSETTIMDSGLKNYFRLHSKLLVTEIVNIMRINLVVRLGKPVLRRLQSFPEKIVMRAEGMKKGKETRKEY